MSEDVTQLLNNLRAGDKSAETDLMSLVYVELHAMAARLMRRERSDHTLQATALVNEAYLKLVARSDTDWKDRAHFFGVAAHVMRHVLVDHARQRLTGKRGAGAELLPLDEALVISSDRLEDLLILEDALRKLEAEDWRASQVVIYRFYGGLEVEQIAQVMDIGARTVKRDWNFARAWLNAKLSPKSRSAAHD